MRRIQSGITPAASPSMPREPNCHLQHYREWTEAVARILQKNRIPAIITGAGCLPVQIIETGTVLSRVCDETTYYTPLVARTNDAQFADPVTP
jgi:hypothetical protein